MDIEKIMKIIDDFNKKFGAKCELINFDDKNKEIKILFKGEICFTCGTYDYFEDLAYLLSNNLNEEFGIEKYEQNDEEYIVTYKPKKYIKNAKRDIKVIFYDF